MSTRQMAVTGIMAVAALAAGCSDGRTPVAPSTERPGVEANRVGDALPLPAQQELLGRRAENARLASQIPGFGGMFYDKAGNLQVVVARSGRRANASAAQMRNQIRQALSARGGAAAAAPDNFAVMDGQYTIEELEDMRARARDVLTMKGVVFLGTKESANRIAVGLDQTNANPARLARQVMKKLADLGVPKEAVVIHQVARVTPVVTTLRDRVRPVMGGLQIYFPVPPSAFICTLGFNARLGASPDNYFLTNSHCTQKQGGVDGTQYFQPLPGASNFIGVEVADPVYGTGGGYCPTGRRCRFSDASMAKYDPSVTVAFGALAHTTFTLDRRGSLELDGTNPMFQIVREAPYPREGQLLSKVGRTTGWTTGIVDFACFDSNVSGTDVTLICQDFVEAGVGAGDSGSTVFQQIGTTNTATLYGLMWGSSAVTYTDGSIATLFVFSDMENIHLEMGAFRTF